MGDANEKVLDYLRAEDAKIVGAIDTVASKAITLLLVVITFLAAQSAGFLNNADVIGWLRARRREDEIAAGYFRRYLLRVPRSDARLSLAKALMRLKRDDAARRQVERFLISNPNHAEAKRMFLEFRTK